MADKEAMTEETKKAIEDTRRIHERLQSILPQYPHGFTIKKSQLRERFDLPSTRAVKVWWMLSEMGYEISHTSIFVNPSAELAAQKQKEQATKAAESDLDSVLND